ncbi:MAG: hypothetical protein HOP18_01590, partial [Deltaproteobacteria bacterium]|nr:hypothetical protein [Deltaproteobacteria bacterium]
NTAAARLVNIVNKTSGGVTLSGNLSGTGSSTGLNVQNNTTNGTLAFTGGSKVLTTGANPAVTLDNNDNATINFSGGGLAITTTSGTGFTALNGATAINVTGTGNTITSTTGTALNVNNSTIGGAGLTFQSIAANGGSNTGIILDTTGSLGGLTVSGTGSAGSGGTIANKTGADGSTSTGIGVYLNNTRNVSLGRMQLNDFQNFAIRGSNVVGFSMSNTVINTAVATNANGTNDVPPFNEGNISFTNLTGAASLSNCTISRGFADNFRLVNSSGTLNRLVFDTVTMGANSNSGNDSILIEGTSNATLNVTVQNSTFTGAAGDLFNYILNGNNTGDLVFTGNTLSNNHPVIATGGGGVTVVSGNNVGAGATFTFDMSNNTFRDAVGTAVLIVKSTDPGSVIGTFANNSIGVQAVANSGSAEGSGLKLQSVGLGTMTVAVTNNSIRQYNNFGIEVLAGGSATPQGGVINTTVTGNLIAEPGNTVGTEALSKNGIHYNIGTVVGDTYQACALIGGAGALANNIHLSGKDGIPPTGLGDVDFRIRNRRVGVNIRLPGYAGPTGAGAATDADINGYLAPRNSTGGTPVGAAHGVTGTYTGTGTTCP